MIMKRFMAVFVVVLLLFSAFGFIGLETISVESGLNAPGRTSDDSYEDNDNISTAALVGFGMHSNLKCFDDDWYMIRLTAGTDLTVTLYFNHSRGDLDLGLYDSNGQIRSSQTDSDTESVSMNPVPFSGIYYIRVYGYNNSNNTYTMYISNADVTPPKITSSITLTHLSATAVKFQWTTDEPCTSIINYGKKLGYFDNAQTDSTFTNAHTVTIKELVERSTYNYKITSIDRYHNSGESDPYYFSTHAEKDTENPTVRLSDFGVVKKPTNVFAFATDNNGIEKVEFYLEDDLKHTDFTHNYEWLLDPSDLSDGRYTLSAKAYDLAGNTALVRKTITVSKPVPDRSAPEITITTNFKSMKVKGGLIPVELSTVDSDSGIAAVAFYVDGEHKWTNVLDRQSRETQETMFYWDTTGLESKSTHTLAVKAINSEGLSAVAETDVTVESGSEPIPAPSKDDIKINPVEVIRGQVRHEKTHYEVILYVKNKGSEPIHEVNVFDYNLGFQTISSSYGYVPWASYDPSSQCSNILFRLDTMMPGEVKTLKYNMVPVLFAPDPRIDFTIGKKTVVEFKEEVGTNNFIKHTTTFYVQSVEMLPSWYAVNPVPIIWQNILPDIKEKDYIITTHPGNLYAVDPNAYGVDETLSEMAKLAEEKNGVLGYLTDWGNDIIDELRNAIEPQYIYNFYADRIHQGGWNHYVTPGWETSGYLLIVGEVEVVPAVTYILTLWNTKHQKYIDYDIPLSDHYYSDLLGDGGPDVIVGRLIGDTGLKLAEQIKTSLGVHKGSTGFGFDGSHALAVSGVGNYYDGFVEQVDNIGTSLGNKNVFHYELHWKDYISAKSFPRTFDHQFGLAVGNLGGNAEDEILIANHIDGKVYVYKADGQLHYTMNLGFSAGDAIAVGDIDGDGNAEVIHAIDSINRVNIHNAIYLNNGNVLTGSLGGFNIDFSSNDGLAVGDVRYDSKAEILVADVSAGKVFIFDDEPKLRGSFLKNMLPFENHQGFGVGNVDYVDSPFDKEEVVIAGTTTDSQRIYTLDGYGFEKHSFASSWTNQDSLAVGNVFWSGIPYQNKAEEIIIRNSTDNTIWGLNGTGDYNFEVPVNLRAPDDYDVIAVGNLIPGVRNEIVYADRSDDMIYFFDDLWGYRMNAAFELFSGEKDIIYWGGHGFAEGWGSGVDINHIPSDFEGVNPFVMAMSCTTGLYDYFNANNEHKDLSIAEKFLDQGAGVYIGATRLTNTGTNQEGGETYFESYWNPALTVGNSYNNLERDAWSVFSQSSTFGGVWLRWVLAYNIYGDPKYKVVETEDTPVFNLGNLKSFGFLNLDGTGRGGTTYKMEVPDYIVSNEGDHHNVDIPGGLTKLERDHYRVPFYHESLVVPEGYRVSDVDLNSRGGLIRNNSLKLGRVTTDDIVSGDPLGRPPSEKLEPGKEWYPYEDFSWSVRENQNGTSTLDIIVYPFFYNQKTLESMYYTGFDFDINYIRSDVEIVEQKLSSPHYDPGELAEVELTLNNRGTGSADVILTGEVISQASSGTVTGLPLNRLNLNPGLSTVSLVFDTDNFEEGTYDIEIIALDLTGSNLDIRTGRIRIGVSRAEVIGVPLSSTFYEEGDPVIFDFEFPNTGSTVINGAAVVTVKHESGVVVAQEYFNIKDLLPNETAEIRYVWDTEGAAGRYTISAALFFDSKTVISESFEITDHIGGVLDLIDELSYTYLEHGLRKSLQSKLENAVSSLEKGNERTAAKLLGAFINECEAQGGKKLTDVQAVVLIEAARSIINDILE